MDNITHLSIKRALRLAFEWLKSEVAIAQITGANAADVADWRNPESSSVPDLAQSAAIDVACLARGADRAALFEAYAGVLDTVEARQPIRSIELIRAALDLQRQVGRLAQTMFTATATGSEAGENIGPGERLDLQEQVDAIALASTRLQTLTE